MKPNYQPIFSFFLFCLLFGITNPKLVFSQKTVSYTPQQTGTAQDFFQTLADIDAKLAFDLDVIESDKSLLKTQRKELILQYTHRAEQIKAKITNREFIIDPRIHDVVQHTFKHILASNPNLPKDQIRLFISREPIPNASCYGEGSLLINIGLLSRLENESQLAFVLCHELAHFTQNHVNKRIRDQIVFLYSKETQATLKQIARSDYGRYQKMQKMFGEVMYGNRRHDRSRELEADSIAIYYLQNTQYDVQEAVNCLKVLDEIDKPKYLVGLDFKKHFDHPELPFDFGWIAIEENDFIQGSIYQPWEVDSLKTHPSCEKRYRIVERRAATGRSPFIQSPEAFMEMTHLAEFELIESYYFYGNYGKCIHESLQYLEAFPDNAYLQAKIAICLHAILEAKMDHEQGKHVELPDDEQLTSYRSLLTMLYNLSLKEYKKLMYYYIQARKTNHLTDEHFLYAMYLGAEAVNDEGEMGYCKRAYRKLFPEGQYTAQILN